jgi:uncharacterized membrane protein
MNGEARAQLNVAAVLRRVWAIYFEQAPVLMPVAAVVFTANALLAFILLASGSVGGLLAAVVITLGAYALLAGVVVELVGELREGRRQVDHRRLLLMVAPVMGPLMLVIVVVGFVMTLLLMGLVVLVGAYGLPVWALVLLYLFTVWFVFAPVVVRERAPGLRALARSRELVRGNGWPVFAVAMLTFVLPTLAVGRVEQAAVSSRAGVWVVVWVVVGVLTAPISTLASAVLYFELCDLKAGTAAPGPFGPSPSGSVPPESQ